MNGEIALFSLKAPEDPLNGGDLRIWTLLGGGDATVVCLGRKDVNGDGEKLEARLPWRHVHQIAGDVVFPPLPIWEWSEKRWMRSSPGHFSSLQGALEEVVISRPGMAWLACPLLDGLLLSSLVPDYRPAIDITDSNSLYFLRRFRNLRNSHPLKRMNALYQSWRWLQLERKAALGASAVFTAGEEDRAYLSRHTGARVLSFGSGTPWVDEPVLPKACDPKVRRIAFFGGMTWEPNRLAARYLATNLLPVLRRMDASLEIQIAGAASGRYLADLEATEGVRMRGFIPDLRAWLATCDVFVMPMFQGAGVKSKLIEAMAAGMAVVTNEIGAESLPARARSAVVIAEGTEAMAAAVMEVIGNPARRGELERKAREAAEHCFSPLAVSAAYRDAVLSTTRPWTIGR
jgi:glycosyltransferase involved in cell wall biosynthesis